MKEYLIRRNTVLEALRGSRRQIFCLWLQKGLAGKVTRPFTTAAQSRNIPIKTADKSKLSNLAQDGSHQGAVLEVGPYVYSDVSEILAVAADRGEKPFVLLLDLLHGPQNIGALLRTAEIVGTHGVILQDRRAPDITTAVVQYSAGAAEHLHIAQVTNLVQTMKQLQQAGLWLVGMDLAAGAQPMPEVDLNIPIGIVVGHEGQGMRRLVRKSCDIRLTLPQKGEVESLNAAVAGSILLYQAWQARGYS
ncbi:MAG: 23S rRNA (guanosine(2251)-2'-O)-methyltransferase RlmB [Chloroflexi bacterium]|nr:23S rRNA (guanosine(2251)-2'-O)-methyltransferase RlmB [Chloroflexota bacterium]